MFIFYYFFKGIDDLFITDEFLGEIGDVIYNKFTGQYLEIADYAEEWIDDWTVFRDC